MHPEERYRHMDDDFQVQLSPKALEVKACAQWVLLRDTKWDEA